MSNEPDANLRFQPKSALFMQDSDSSQIAYSHPSMSICEETEPAQKSSHLDSKASFATDSDLWHQQWELFAPNFHDGKAHIDLGQSGTLPLLPGAGFGDLSHPTTRLMLRMMEGKIEGKSIVDIGCGSGILSLAAAKMGAGEVLGVDIDPEAIEHANKNLALNDLGEIVQFSLAPLEAFTPKLPLIILMNIIPAEQETAWAASLPLHPTLTCPTGGKFSGPLHAMKKFIITSGVLSEALPAYLQWAEAQGWALIKQIEETNWHCLLFSY